MKKEFSNNKHNEKYIIVVAHPDDETVWASSILEKASKVIICFSEDKESEKTSKGRKNFFKNSPDNFYCLNMIEPLQKSVIFIPNKNHIRNCISDPSFKKIKNILRELIDCPVVYTHSYWGEYGHPQHIAIHMAVRDICKEKKIICKTFSYFNLRTYFLRNYFLKKNNITVERKKVSKKLFYSLRDIYISSNCWTFSKLYLPPKYEYFYVINQSIRNRNFQKKKIPGIYFFWGELQYKLNFHQISVKDFRFFFSILLIDLALMPPYLLKYIFKKLLKLK